MGAWGCPHEIDGRCQRIKGRECDPGMKGCILYGRFVWSNEAKNRPPRSPETPPSRQPQTARRQGEAPSD